MTRKELRGLPSPRPEIARMFLRTHKEDAIRERIHNSLIVEYPRYNSMTVDAAYGTWRTDPPTIFTLFDYLSLAAQSERRQTLYGEHATVEMQKYGKIGEVVNTIAKQVVEKQKRGVQQHQLSSLEIAAYNLWVNGAGYFREATVLAEGDAINGLPTQILATEERKKHGLKKVGHGLLHHGSSHVVSHAISHGVRHVLITSGIMAETALTGGSGFVFNYIIGKIGMKGISMVIEKLRESPLSGVVFDGGTHAELTLQHKELAKSFSAFINAARDAKVEIPVRVGRKRRGEPKIKNVPLFPYRQYTFMDAFHAAEAIYYLQSPEDFARGPFSHRSAAYLGLRRGEWSNNYQSLLN